MDHLQSAVIPPEEKFLHIRYEQRWEHLKPAILRLFLGQDGLEKMTIETLANFMRDKYQFAAQ